MKKSSSLLVICLLLLCQSFFAQDLDLKWSENLVYQNKKDGFFSSIIGSDEDKLFSIFTNIATFSSSYSKIKIVSFDKSTLRKTASVALKGYKENSADQAKYKNLQYYKTIVLNDEIFVFWNQITNTKAKKVEELYVETFDTDLRKKTKLKKVFTADLDTDVKISRNSSSRLTVLYNKDISDVIIVGYELPIKDEKVVFKYTTLNQDLETGDLQTIDLPIKLATKKSYGKTSKYTFGKDGNIFIQSYISLTKEERKAAKKGENTSYCVFSIVNPETNEVSKFELKKENYNINDFSFIITKNKIKIYGFFCDLEKDPTGYSTHGVFRSEISSETLEDDGINFTYFDKATISSLFAKDKEDAKKTKPAKKKKGKNQGNDEEALDINFVIEEMFLNENDEIVLFCSKMRNYSVTTCSTSSTGASQCVTRYYCEKSNVTAIKVSNEGEIIWASNLDRKMTYSGTSVFDLNIVYKNKKYYVIYGSAYASDAEVKNRKSRKKISEYRDTFEYGIFEDEDGKFEKNTFTVNDKSVTDKKLKKSVNPLSIQAIDGNFYVDYKKVNPWSYMYCAYVVILNPGAIKANGNLGVISIIEGGGNGKKKKKK